MIAERKMARPRGWNRDALVCLFVHQSAGAWAKLPAYAPEALSPEGRARGVVKGLAVPAECFGRDVDQSQVNSLRAYIRDVVLVAIAAVGIDAPSIDRVATILADRDGTPTVMVYRRQ